MVKTSLDVKCKQHEIGCKWQGKIIDYQVSLKICQFDYLINYSKIKILCSKIKSVAKVKYVGRHGK